MAAVADALVVVRDLDQRVLRLAGHGAAFLALRAAPSPLRMVWSSDNVNAVQLRDPATGRCLAPMADGPVVGLMDDDVAWRVRSLGAARVQLVCEATGQPRWLVAAPIDEHTSSLNTTTNQGDAAVFTITAHTTEPAWLVRPRDEAFADVARALQDDLTQTRMALRTLETRASFGQSRRAFPMLPDTTFSASSCWRHPSGETCTASDSRLHRPSALGGWAPHEEMNAWIQVDLGQECLVTHVLLQPRGDPQAGPIRLRRGDLMFAPSNDPNHFQVFREISDEHTEAEIAANRAIITEIPLLPDGVVARYLRLRVHAVDGMKPVFRWDVKCVLQ